MKQSKKVILFSIFALLAGSNSHANLLQQLGVYKMIVDFFSGKNLFAGMGNAGVQNEQNQIPQQESLQIPSNLTEYQQNLLHQAFPEYKLFGSRMGAIEQIIFNLEILKTLTPKQKELFETELSSMVGLPLNERIEKIKRITLPYLNDSEKHKLCFIFGELFKERNPIISDYVSVFLNETVVSIKKEGGINTIVFASGKKIHFEANDPRANMILQSIFLDDITEIYGNLYCESCIKRDLFGPEELGVWSR